MHSCSGPYDCRHQLYHASLGENGKIIKRNLGTIAKFIVTGKSGEQWTLENMAD